MASISGDTCLLSPARELMDPVLFVIHHEIEEERTNAQKSSLVAIGVGAAVVILILALKDHIVAY